MTTATIIGSGPNGLSAAIVLAAAGIDIKVLELNSRIGGACSTAETTLPGTLIANDIVDAHTALHLRDLVAKGATKSLRTPSLRPCCLIPIVENIIIVIERRRTV
jgi:ribulose 1,5-bisphosphate synthetase/thiazole synthase